MVDICTLYSAPPFFSGCKVCCMNQELFSALEKSGLCLVGGVLSPEIKFSETLPFDPSMHIWWDPQPLHNGRG
jgi:hypothetical protein